MFYCRKKNKKIGKIIVRPFCTYISYYTKEIKIPLGIEKIANIAWQLYQLQICYRYENQEKRIN